jgi:hypothetical protein
MPSPRRPTRFSTTTLIVHVHACASFWQSQHIVVSRTDVVWHWCRPRENAQDESASRDAVSTKIKQSVYTTHLVAGRLGGVQHWPFVPPTCSFLPSSSGEVRVCHTRAPMQHEEKQSNGVFSHPHTSYRITPQIRQCMARVMSNPSSSTPASEQHPKNPWEKLRDGNRPRIRHV